MKRLPFIALAFAMVAAAQTAPSDGKAYPEVHADRTVLFRLTAPKATEVTLYGDWMVPNNPEKMTKGADGVWTLTTAPLEALGHLYWFNLDGIAIPDPINPRIKMRQRTSASLFEVPGPAPAAWDLADVPHGSLITEWRKSAVLDRTERIVVYLPPGYLKGSAKYPVLYLNHGSGDVQESWTQVGHANIIFDNLIAQGKAKPMIVVMPAGHSVPFGGRGGNNTDLFEKYLTTEVIPFIDATYKVAPGSKNRAIAGLSMGGGHTIRTGFDHPELFSALGIFSPAIPANFEETKKDLLADAKGTNAKLNLIWIACGDKDNTVQYPRVKAFAEMLGKHGIKENFTTYEGAHTWPVWRRSLADFAPLLFQSGK